jgi:hypothetical protein
MSKAKHTPGPWKVYPPSPNNPSRATVSAANGQCTIYDAPLTTETAANARLIAATPEMVELLKKTLPFVQHYGHYYLGEINAEFLERQVRALLAELEE